MRQTILTFCMLLVLCAALITSNSPADARSLRDMIKRSPELFTPSQILAGQQAAFTVRGKAGYGVKVILSPFDTGLSTNDGTKLRVGRPTVDATGVIPESGVLTLNLTIPEDSELLGDQQFVEALVWAPETPDQVEMAQIISSSGLPAANNVIAVGIAADPGTMLVVPGDPTMGSLMRSIGQLNDVRGNDRKQELIDDGKINRERMIDRTLSTPAN